MTGPRPAGRPWIPTEDAQLRELAVSGVKVGLIAKKLKRSAGAIYARINLVFGPRSGSLPPGVWRLMRKLRPAISKTAIDGGFGPHGKVRPSGPQRA